MPCRQLTYSNIVLEVMSTTLLEKVELPLIQAGVLSSNQD